MIELDCDSKCCQWMPLNLMISDRGPSDNN